MSDVKNSSLATGLVSYWELDEASGTRADAHGSNDLTDNNTVGSATGIQGDGADIERDNNEYLSISDASQTGLDITGDLSVSGWVKLESYAPRFNAWQLAGKYRSSTNDRSYEFAVARDVSGNTTPGAADCVIRFYGTPNGTTTNSFSWDSTARLDTLGVTLGSWFHYVFIIDCTNNDMKCYLNGVEVAGTMFRSPSSIYNGSAPFEIGRYNSSGASSDGVIDEVGVWSRALSAADVTDLYNSGAGIPYEAAAGSSIKSIDGVLKANIKSFNGVLDASVKSVNGISNV